MLTSLRKSGTSKLSTYFKDVRRILNGDKTAIITIHSGLNDRNRTQGSIGPIGGFPSNSPEGYADNLMGLVHLLSQAWELAGGDSHSLHFAFMPSHALSEPDDAQLSKYRAAARDLAEKLPNASMIDLSILMPYKEMRANKYYDKGRPSDAHLQRTGYEAIASALATQLQTQ
ncbi:SGNH/GDSL hydrolase family protein [Coraliomargarita algicola]|uniref:SGNH/GDSL hydrolase family protein n=1 Tax=Coraliomargarita algicola TaxID=3092156 RepID=A0ABZ0RM32_9BACT|nr:SGNH/GDSL hydrolase family protein [Coraliomargarita sp. J2-16]WPJ96294.1 SGNH/GDSL hydrolase family protein [Coraliomargarita sp. J2-16]